MNERIKLLAEQAGYKHPAAVGTYEDYTYFDYEKFAELLIRKCAKIADVADENKCEWIGGNILTHFGVEK